MKLYDESIRHWLHLIQELPNRQLLASEDTREEQSESLWPDQGKNNMILRSDMAYELGGDSRSAISGLAITEDATLVPEDQVQLFGPDLGEINEDISYARLAIVRVKEHSLGEGNTLYNAIRKIEYVRYHVNPQGYMMRISASQHREPVRIGREAIKQGLDFAKVGQTFIKEYHKNPEIQAVKLIFITQQDFPYKQLEALVAKNEQITAAIDHILKNVTMDCGACNLKPICDEVEGMKELHFQSQQED